MQLNGLQLFSILIVDDEKLISKLVLALLTKLGFRDITVADSGRKAIEYASQRKFDFIITDWRMKDLDGIDIVNFVRRAPESPHPAMPIVMVTGNTEAHYVLTAMNSGVNDYLLKPFTAEQFVKRIRTVIERPYPFVDSETYRGPDRRRSDRGGPENVERRGGPNNRKPLS